MNSFRKMTLAIRHFNGVTNNSVVIKPGVEIL